MRGKERGPIELHKLMGQALFKLSRFEEAIPHLERAVQGDDRGALLPLAQCLLLNGDLDAAWKLIEPMLDADTVEVDVVGLASLIELRRGDPGAAVALIDRTGLRDSGLDVTRAQALLALGDARGAIAAVEPWFDDPTLDDATRAWVLFEGAAAYEAAGQYDDAFARYRRGNELAKGRFDPVRHAVQIGRIIERWSERALAEAPRASVRSDRPVFIVGMPRSGTTLVEQMLASHPSVYGAGELTTLGTLVGTQGGGPVPPAGSPTVRAADTLAASYLGSLGASAALRVTDKQPLNFMLLGWVAVLFPDAHVVHCARDARDTCLSCYFRLFRDAHPWSCDLAWAGAFFREYERLMAHWEGVLPGAGLRMTTARYEDLVDDPAAQASRLQSFVGLEPTDAGSLGESARVRRTLRFDQKGEGVFKTSAGKWKRYQRHLGPLLESLGADPN